MNALNFVIALVFLAAAAVAQDSSREVLNSGAPKPVVIGDPAPQSTASTNISVEIIGSRTHTLASPLKFTVLLMNKGTNRVYVSKSFTRPKGGQAGFYVYVKQLSGRRSEYICDSFPIGPIPLRLFDQRTAYELLRDDFVLLEPGAFVGSELAPEGCSVAHPGVYEAKAVYFPPDLPPLNVQDATVLQTGIESKPFRFSVQQRRSGGERK